MAKNLAEFIVTSPSVPSITPTLYWEGIAIHELVHLSGIPDIAYFILKRDPAGGATKIQVEAAPSVLETIQNGTLKGGLFEEGFATLCDHLYLWSKIPGVADDTRTESKRSPVGDMVSLPVRHTYAASSYMYLASTLDRLIGCLPGLWDIFVASRSYGASSTEIRNQVKQEIDHLDTRLFAVLDAVDSHNLNDCISAAYITDMVAKRVVEGKRLFSPS